MVKLHLAVLQIVLRPLLGPPGAVNLEPPAEGLVHNLPINPSIRPSALNPNGNKYFKPQFLGLRVEIQSRQLVCGHLDGGAERDLQAGVHVHPGRRQIFAHCHKENVVALETLRVLHSQFDGEEFRAISLLVLQSAINNIGECT